MMISERMDTTIVKKCDVLVCGGGFGGISAAPKEREILFVSP